MNQWNKTRSKQKRQTESEQSSENKDKTENNPAITPLSQKARPHAKNSVTEVVTPVNKQRVNVTVLRTKKK